MAAETEVATSTAAAAAVPETSLLDQAITATKQTERDQPRN